MTSDQTVTLDKTIHSILQRFVGREDTPAMRSEMKDAMCGVAKLAVEMNFPVEHITESIQRFGREAQSENERDAVAA